MRASKALGSLLVEVEEYDADNVGIYHGGNLLCSVRVVNGALSLITHPLSGTTGVNVDSGRMEVYGVSGLLAGS